MEKSKPNAGFITIFLIIITGTISLLLLSYRSSFKTFQKNAQLSAFTQLVATVRLVLSNPKDCQQAFSSQKYDPDNSSPHLSSSDPNWIPSMSVINSGVTKELVKSGHYYKNLTRVSMYFNNFRQDPITGAPINKSPVLPQQLGIVQTPNPADTLNPFLLVLGNNGVVGVPMAPPVLYYSYLTAVHVDAQTDSPTFTAEIPVLVTTDANGALGKVKFCNSVNTSTLIVPANPTVTFSTLFPYPWVTKGMCDTFNGSHGGYNPIQAAPLVYPDPTTPTVSSNPWKLKSYSSNGFSFDSWGETLCP